MSPGTLTVVGGGNMGGAILRRLLDAAAFARFIVADPDAAKAATFAPAEHLPTAEAVAAADVVLLAVKPQAMAEVIDGVDATGKLVISVAAGLSTAWLEGRLPGARVVRTMPNTPLLVGRGTVGVCGGSTATADDVAAAKTLFPGCTILDVAESQMDALTAVSGSGPAYCFAFVEALAAAAEAEGFDAETAYTLAAETFAGAAALLDTGAAADLRRRVTSPGGTTAAGLAEMDALPNMLRRVVAAAAERGRELSSG